MIEVSHTPTRTFATDEHYRDRNWNKHRTDVSFGGAVYDHSADFAALDQQRFTRQMVFDHFDTSERKGVVSAIKWGYPKGSLPGGKWRSFSAAFRSDALVECVAKLRAMPETAVRTVVSLNACVSGIGTATTTKLAYFAGLRTTDGHQCLIYDSMVRRAIRAIDMPEFIELAAIIRRSPRDLTPRQQEETYGLYLAGVHQLADDHEVAPDAIELSLFLAGRAQRPT